MNDETMSEDTNNKDGEEQEPQSTKQDDQAKVEISKIFEGSLTCPTSVLAAQMRKVVPSANFTNSRSSVDMIDNLFDQKEKADLTGRDQMTIGSLHNVNLTSEIEMEQLMSEETRRDLEKNTHKAKEVESIIRDFPVPIKEKRLRRSNIMPIIKKSWSEKITELFSEIAENLQPLLLWNEDLKIIEGKFGASIVSFFYFIRWLLFMNLIILALNVTFLVVPQYTFLPRQIQIPANLTFNETITANYSLTKVLRKKAVVIKSTADPDGDTKTVTLSGAEEDWPQFEAYDEAALNNSNSAIDLIKYCHSRYVTEIENETNSGFFARIQDLLQGTGYLEHTILFIGSYPMEETFFFGQIYYMPLAVIWVLIVSFSISLIMMVNYASFGIQEAFLTQEHVHSFANDIFCGWDFCITSPEAAALHHEKFVLGLKSNLAEAQRKKEIAQRTNAEWIALYCKRLVANIVVILYLIFCYFIIYKVALFQLHEYKTNQLEEAGLRSLVIQFLPSMTCIVINFVSPFVFDILAAFEKYHGQTEVNVTVIRNSFTSLSSIIVLISTFHNQITCKPRSICGSGRSYDCRTPRCWETYVGQELYKISLSQLFIIIGIFLFVDIPRNYIAKNYNNKFTRLMGRPPFLLPIELLDPVYAQAVLWLGVFYSPMLPFITVLILVILFYIKKAKVLKYSIPSTMLYKASRFNSTFMNILLTAFIVILAIHMYTLVRIRPSLGCSPFRVYNSMVHALRRAFQFLPFDLITVINFIFSGWFLALVNIFMCVIIYYYWKYIQVLENLEKSLKADLHIINQDKQFLLKSVEEIVKKSN
ncbi:hypothetical protein JTE90_019221 [Oedothorax gibbosus]|uniref:TMC domain-containing protein n=1 Tax=Oedothorax gibbosus TaxID=931172 RepID=A0AAV6UBS6_9ARAC|nr:hypothetical protein JTE90_019221 [Oedothorax gibbosus]